MKKNKKSKRRLLLFAPLSIIAIGYFLFTFVSYIISYSALKMEENNLKKQLVSLQEERANLKIEITKLNNPEYVARYAKENYLYSGDGEYIIKIDNTENLKEEAKTGNNYAIYIIGGSSLVLITFITIKLKKKKIVQK